MWLHNQIFQQDHWVKHIKKQNYTIKCSQKSPSWPKEEKEKKVRKENKEKGGQDLKEKMYKEIFNKIKKYIVIIKKSLIIYCLHNKNYTSLRNIFRSFIFNFF